ESLRRIVIPADLKREVRDRLDQTGVTSGFCFRVSTGYRRRCHAIMGTAPENSRADVGSGGFARFLLALD
ncbi:MAG: hypothetical protein H8F28_15510, partial [Fibrella sp.]|nr:hypothetical protein [Armatimonadota bacterium]